MWCFKKCPSFQVPTWLPSLKAGYVPALSFPSTGPLSSMKFPGGMEPCWLGMGCCRQDETVFLSFWMAIPRFPPLQFWSFFSGLQSSPRADYYWSLGGFGGLGGGDARTILVMSIWWILPKALPLPQPKLLVFTWFFLSLLFSLGYKWLSNPCLYSRHSLPPHWSNCLMILLDRYLTRAPTQNCQSHRGHPSHREAFPTVPSIMNDITTFPAARARIWEPSLTSCFPSCSPANLFIKLIPFLKSPGYS